MISEFGRGMGYGTEVSVGAWGEKMLYSGHRAGRWSKNSFLGHGAGRGFGHGAGHVASKVSTQGMLASVTSMSGAFIFSAH